jgi:hypothetical protein
MMNLGTQTPCNENSAKDNIVVLAEFMAGLGLDDRDSVCNRAVEIFLCHHIQTHFTAYLAS